MKPYQLCTIGIIIGLVFLLLSRFVPGPHQIWHLFTIKIPSFQLSNETHTYKDISRILKLSSRLGSDSVNNLQKQPDKKEQQRLNDKGTILLNTDSLTNILRPLEFPNGNDTLLFPFFNSLQEPQISHHLIRVMHYGDSQIEGDRITSYLRAQLQSRFGGCGIGLLPVVLSCPGTSPYTYFVSNNWIRYSLLNQSALNGNYGPLLSFARFTPVGELKSSKEETAWITMDHAIVSNPLIQRFETCKIFYVHKKTPMLVMLSQDNKVLDADIVPPSEKMKSIEWKMSESSRNITITFKTQTSLDVFAISLEGKYGVAVDNIPLRGSTGQEFLRSNPAFLKAFFQQENVKLLILQFGVNMVPYANNHYDYHEKVVLRQLQLIRSCIPDIPVIVIGVSDVSVNGNNGYETSPNLSSIRDFQKKAAFQAGCAFWDIYEAMGGKNSMPSWVFANPSLAQKDFIHFNPLGAKLIGEMFYSAIMKEYNHYCSLKNTNSL